MKQKHPKLKNSGARSPFAIPGIKTKATTKDILRAVKDSRERFAKPVKSTVARS